MNGLIRIASVVEGHGEVQGLPRMIQRIAQEKCATYVDAPKPHRVPRATMVHRPEELQKAVRFQAARFDGPGGVVVLADSDDDDADDLCRVLQESVDAAGASRPVVATVAVREYEAWFLAGIESLRSHGAVRDSAAYDGDPERPRNPKLRLEELMYESYGSVRHQVAFNMLLDLDRAAERSPSFARFVESLGSLVRGEGT
ncbi:DUF4276 family protein [Isoptericola sp. BMS4]|uniref:DUF4276 family protein n=1 Tax=Isoptericola sp. BMS4 TaxID=2527875 RepID=UPI0014218D7F|nr:DUF4276 family protein [Isoptericola sp. BMS4]